MNLQSNTTAQGSRAILDSAWDASRSAPVESRVDGWPKGLAGRLLVGNGHAPAVAEGLAHGRSDERERLSILEDPARRSRVFMGMARRLSQNPSQHKDLIQEAIIHAWQIMEAQPGQRQSWYLQSCFDHLRNYVRRGRSVDSARRQQSAAERELTHTISQRTSVETSEAPPRPIPAP